MARKFEEAIERLRKAQEQILVETTETLGRAIKAQAEFVFQATDLMTRGYVGVINGTTGAIMQSYAGFLDGFSRALERVPNKTAKKARHRKTGGKRK
jgi:alkyl sulfatase BDS1-like metallo-beta-lactamase superfamily hydrolase